MTENKSMNKRVYGVIGIKSIMANWNADFTGYPRTTSDCEVFASDKALKYPMKQMWKADKNNKLLYVKTFMADFKPMGIDTKFKNEFNIELMDCENSKKAKKKDTENKSKEEQQDLEKYKQEIVKNLFSCIDVKQFGCTFAPATKGNNLSITGAVQIAQGFNKYEETCPQVMKISSPFPTEEGDASSTLGTKIVSNEAHYAYHFAINPDAYADFVEMGVTEGYTEEDYEKFKEAALTSATSFNTNSKVGCENELAVFVETDKNTYLPDLSQYVYFKKADDESEKDTIELKFDKILNDVKDKIQSVEIYYNPYTTTIVADIENAKMMNIFTQDEVE